MPTLYPAQCAAVRRYLSLPRPRRFLFPWKTGCGKTAGALTAAAAGAGRVLIVCPAIVRVHWRREAKRWAGWDGADLGLIEWGRERKLPRAQAEARDVAYAATGQIVSYDLLGHVDCEGWDTIIFDEVHHIASPLSVQAKRARAIILANPKADILGLSATLIPTEVKQLWNPLRLLFGEAEWGKPARTGKESWDFLMRYCNTERNEWGMRAWGVREDAREELRERLAAVAHPLTREDIASDLPPLDVNLLELPEVTRNKLPTQLLEWHDSLDEAVSHRVILVRHRALARELHTSLIEGQTHRADLADTTLRYIDGQIPTGARQAILDICASSRRCTLVATHESLAEGIRLMWADQAIIAEWSQSPGRVIQLLGRFNSIGSTERPQVAIATHGSDYGAACNLIERTQAVMDALGESPRETEVMSTFAKAADFSDITSDEWQSLFDSHKPDDWSDDDDQT